MKTSIIYETRGKAREYCELAVNLYRGCAHQCLYCYVPDATFQSRDEFSKPKPRKYALEKLHEDIKKLNGEKRPVLLSFTSDPYQPIEEIHELTHRAIRILHNGGLNVVVLTKGGLRAERDFGILTDKDSVGVTLTFLNDNDSRKWEPYAALPAERIELLKRAKARNISTWASLEPVIDPEQTLKLICVSAPYVDEFKVGKLNHHPLADEIDWHRFGHEAERLLINLKKMYYIKRDLKLAMSRR